MRALVIYCFAAVTAIAQGTSNSSPELPKEPLALLQAAALHYNFNDPAMRPFHLKATYQLYDESGQPAEKGAYEYWWASPAANRSSWTRDGATHTDWHTADGKHAFLGTGDALKFLEFKLQSALFSPLPADSDLDPSTSRLDRQMMEIGKVRVSCIEVIPKMPYHGQLQTVPLGLFPTYCFDTTVPALRVSYAWGTLTTAYDKIGAVQNRYLARQIEMLEGKRKLLTAEVETVTGLSPNDPALTPASDASIPPVKGEVDLSASVAQGMLLTKVLPVYPQDAKEAHVDGKVVLEAIIGMDGGIHDLRVVSAPWPSLAASALWSVSQWKYKPYLLNGKAVDVKTTINVIYSLGY